MEYGPLNRFLRTIVGIPCKTFAHAPRAREKVDDRDAVSIFALRHAHVLASYATRRTADRFFVAGVFLATIDCLRVFPHFGVQFSNAVVCQGKYSSEI